MERNHGRSARQGVLNLLAIVGIREDGESGGTEGVQCRGSVE